MKNHEKTNLTHKLLNLLSYCLALLLGTSIQIAFLKVKASSDVENTATNSEEQSSQTEGIDLPVIEYDPTSSAEIAKEATPILKDHADANMMLTQQELTTRNNNIAPAIPVQLNKQDITASVAEENTSLSYKKDNLLAQANIGLGYSSYTDTNDVYHNSLSGKYNVSVGINPNTAIGLNLLMLAEQTDASLVGVCYIPEKQLLLKAAANYLWGEQDFSFPSGTYAQDVSQYGAFLSAERAFDEASHPFLHSIGVSSWYTQAHQDSTATPTIYGSSTGSSYNIYYDPQTLSVGQLLGTAMDLQFAPRENLVMKLSLGYEQVKYPFADGSSSIDRNVYQAAKIDYEPIDHLILGTDYKKGSSETKVALRAAMHGWELSLYENWGLNSTQGYKGAMLSYNLTSWNDSKQEPLAKRMRNNIANSNTNVLNEAINRPTQLPLVFLAQVDSSSSTEIASVQESNLPPNSSVVISGDKILVNLPGDNNIAVLNVTMSGPYGTSELDNSSSTYAWADDEEVIISIPALRSAVPASGVYSFTVNTNGSEGEVSIYINSTANE